MNLLEYAVAYARQASATETPTEQEPWKPAPPTLTNVGMNQRKLGRAPFIRLSKKIPAVKVRAPKIVRGVLRGEHKPEVEWKCEITQRDIRVGQAYENQLIAEAEAYAARQRERRA